MGKSKRVIRCRACGAILQTTDRKGSGYISKEILESNPKIPYCNSCYKKMLLLNSSELKENVERDVIKVLSDAAATDALVIWVLDSFTYNGTLNHEIIKKVKKVNVLVVATKADLFDKVTKEDVVKEFIINSFLEAGIKPLSVVMMRNTKEYDFVALRKELDNIRQGHDVYMIGNYMSGKTTLINRFLKSYVNKSKRSIATITYPDTSAQVLEIPLTNSSFFYELPDLPIDTSVVSMVEKDVAKYIIPRKSVTVTSKTIERGESVALGNLVVYSMISGPKTPFKFYSAEGVEYKKIKTTKVDSFLEENFTKKHTRPVSENFSTFTDYDVFDYEMENDGKWHDIGIEGLCWASFIAKGQTIRIFLPKGAALKEFYSKVLK